MFDFFFTQFFAFLIGEKLASFDGLDFHPSPALAKAPAKELSANLREGCCGCTPTGSVGGGYDEILIVVFFIHYAYSISQEVGHL